MPYQTLLHTRADTGACIGRVRSRNAPKHDTYHGVGIWQLAACQNVIFSRLWHPASSCRCCVTYGYSCGTSRRRSLRLSAPWMILHRSWRPGHAVALLHMRHPTASKDRARRSLEAPTCGLFPAVRLEGHSVFRQRRAAPAALSSGAVPLRAVVLQPLLGRYGISMSAREATAATLARFANTSSTAS